jgi:hypothetical protein
MLGAVDMVERETIGATWLEEDPTVEPGVLDGL